MKQIIIHLDNPEIQALEKDGDKIAITKVKKPSSLNIVFYLTCGSLYIEHIMYSFSERVDKLVLFNISIV